MNYSILNDDHFETLEVIEDELFSLLGSAEAAGENENELECLWMDMHSFVNKQRNLRRGQ